MRSGCGGRGIDEMPQCEKRGRCERRRVMASVHKFRECVELVEYEG